MKIFKRDVYKDMLKWKEDNRNSNLHRKVLKIGGQRQVGKTTIAKEFGKNEYKHYTYLNVADCDKDLNVIGFFLGYKNSSSSLSELFKTYDKDFNDNPENLIIIDEIQDSALLYSSIRKFAEELKCDVIVTGSYLGQTAKKDYWESAGNYTFLSLDVLSFEEFLAIFNKRELYNSLSILGDSNEKSYEIIYKYYDLYKLIGGYPQVIEVYLATKNMEQIDAVLENNFVLFCKESVKYIDEVKDRLYFDKIINSMLIKLNSEKKGLNERNFPKEVDKIIKERFAMDIRIKEINVVLSWLVEERVILPCAKAIDCSFINKKLYSRFYLSDLGMARYQAKKFSIPDSDIKGMLNELFVMKSLFNYENKSFMESPIQPCYGVYKDYEIDGLLKSSYDSCIYGIEVKSGNNKTTSLDALLSANKIDYGIAFKNIFKSSSTLQDKKIVMPIIMAPKFNYDLGEKTSTFDLPDLDFF